MIGGAFPGSLPCFGRFFRNWFIREYPNPDLAFSAKEATDRYTTSFDLRACDPTTIKGLHSKFAELNV
jgi:hypothetical protein